MNLFTFRVVTIPFILTRLHAIDIPDIRLEPINLSPDTNNEGVVLLKTGDDWYSICKDGTTKYWGKKEAMVACRQLHYEGGWPIEVDRLATKYSRRSFGDFDCSWPEERLDRCAGASIGTCPASDAAAVHCYRSFSAHLQGGSAPNIGRVEVSYDDLSADVCYESKYSATRDWGFTNVQVVCKELGFPGTMFARRGGNGEGRRPNTVYDFKCNKDKSTSLHECFPEPPVAVPRFSGSSCGVGRNNESNDAVAVCAIPGYIGCFQINTNLHGPSHFDMAINKCRNQCRRLGKPIALLYSGNTCICEGTMPNSTPIGDEYCTSECSGDTDQACGGENAVSAYRVSKGICEDPQQAGDIYYYGDTLSNVNCRPGTAYDVETIQCVLGDSVEEMIWSGILPECEGLTSTPPGLTHGWKKTTIYVTENGPRYIYVAWDFSEIEEEIKYFKVFYSNSANLNFTISVAANQRHLVLSDLRPETSYIISVEVYTTTNQVFKIGDIRVTTKAESESSHLPLIIGAVLGACFLLILLSITLIYLTRRQRANSLDQPSTKSHKMCHYTKPDSPKNMGSELPAAYNSPEVTYIEPEDFPGYSTKIYTSQNSQTTPSSQADDVPYVTYAEPEEFPGYSTRINTTPSSQKNPSIHEAIHTPAPKYINA